MLKRKVFYIFICAIIIICVLAPVRLKEKYKNFMAETNWGLLQKSQVDNETIEEAIDRLITAHDDDANAHIGVGKSLNTHKGQATIDHPADSVVYDKLPRNSIDLKKFLETEFMMITCFETLDAWNGTQADGAGGYTLTILGLRIKTSATNGEMSVVASEAWVGAHLVDFGKNMFFQTSMRFGAITDQTALITMGETKYYGFKVTDGTLYAVHEDGGGETTTEITGITLTDVNVYKAVFDNDNSKIYFYINGVLKATHTTDIPTGTDALTMQYYLETGANVVKYLYVKDLLLSRER